MYAIEPNLRLIKELKNAKGNLFRNDNKLYKQNRPRLSEIFLS